MSNDVLLHGHIYCAERRINEASMKTTYMLPLRSGIYIYPARSMYLKTEPW